MLAQDHLGFIHRATPCGFYYEAATVTTSGQGTMVLVVLFVDRATIVVELDKNTVHMHFPHKYLTLLLCTGQVVEAVQIILSTCLAKQDFLCPKQSREVSVEASRNQKLLVAVRLPILVISLTPCSKAPGQNNITMCLTSLRILQEAETVTSRTESLHALPVV